MNNQALHHDTTEHTTRRLQEENARLRRRIAEMEQAHAGFQEHTRQGYDLLSRMGHDVRTPLGGMLGYASLLLDEEMTEEMTAAEQREHIKRIETCSRVLLGILNDIFDFAKIRADRVELEQEPFGLCDSVEETLGLLAHNASSGGVNLVSAMDDRVPTQLLGDVERLRQIFMNLVDHLISNSKMRREYEGAPEQTVLVAVKPSSPPAAGTSTTHVHITVSNSCTELSEGPHTTIRTIAATLADTRSSHWHHSKLGLPISYHFVEMMGGRISTEEEGGRICTFHLELPFEPAPTP